MSRWSRLPTPALAAALAAVLVTGCGDADPGAAPELTVPTLPVEMPEAADGIELPSPPPPDVDEAAAVDADGDGATTAGDPSDAGSDPMATEPSRAAAGYTGRDWQDRADGQVVVVADSVAVRDGVVRGMVRNGRTESVGPVTVAVGDARATVPLDVLRPGEPAPFVLELPDADPANLDWVVTAPPADREPVRDLELGTFWQRGVTDPRPVDTYLFSDPSEGPHPAVAFGAARAAAAVGGLRVVAAWVDADGRVLAVDEADVQFDALEAGESSDFLVAADGPDTLDQAELVLWATGS